MATLFVAYEFDPNIVYGGNHVITPIRIKEVIFQSEGSNLHADDVINVMERYYLVTEETSSSLKEAELNTVVATCYEPMEKGKTYVAYIFKSPDDESDPYYYDGQSPYAVSKHSLFCISDDTLSPYLQSDSIYVDMWIDVNSAYKNKQ